MQLSTSRRAECVRSLSLQMVQISSVDELIVDVTVPKILKKIVDVPVLKRTREFAEVVKLETSENTKKQGLDPRPQKW